MTNNQSCSGKSPFFGCRFSLYPMTDQFIPVILDSVEFLKRPGIVAETDDVSTCITGIEENIFSALRDCLAKAASTGYHIALSATFSKGCPGEGEVNYDEYTVPENTDFSAPAEADLNIACQFSIYPMGNTDYMKTIYEIVDITKKNGVFGGSNHFCTRLEGSVKDVFRTLEDCFKYATIKTGHVVMTAAFSCNSPTKI